jgi:hypothetical protein
MARFFVIDIRYADTKAAGSVNGLWSGKPLRSTIFLGTYKKALLHEFYPRTGLIAD